MRLLLILLCKILVSAAIAQNDHGTILYDRTIWYDKVMKSLPYLSEEEKDRTALMWGNNSDGWTSKYVLTFTPDKSVYTYGKEEKSYSYSWKKDEYLIIDELIKRKQTMQFDFGGKLFKLEDDKPRTKWKIENEIREIAGHLCMKATTRDTIRDITIAAWFSNQIPVSAGPEGYSGLPGMILMLDINDGTAIIQATEVQLESPVFDIPKKIKGKDLTFTEYHAMLEKYIKESIEGQRNPYWQIRY